MHHSKGFLIAVEYFTATGAHFHDKPRKSGEPRSPDPGVSVGMGFLTHGLVIIGGRTKFYPSNCFIMLFKRVFVVFF